MKKHISHILFLVLLSFFACKPELDEFEPTAGSADFSTYLALGNSLCAGYADGDLYLSGQMNSFPSILAQQFATVGGGGFKQALMNDELGFGKRLVLGYKNSCTGEASLSPVPIGGTPDPANFNNIGDQGPYNNMGVPGVKTFQVLPAPAPYPPGIYSDPLYGNPYYARFAATPGESVIIEEALALQPTFFTLWLGANDVLTYAISGGTADSITPVSIFEQSMTAIVQMLIQNGAKGAIANIPDISSIPFFSTISKSLPYNGLVLSADEATQLNGAYAQFEAYLQSLGITYSYGISFNEGPNPFIIQDLEIPLPAPFNVRQMQEDELFLLTLPSDSLLCYGMGVPSPDHPELGPNAIPATYVLSHNDIHKIQNTIDEYNSIIQSLAQTYDLAFVDAYSYMQQLETGFVFDAISFNTDFISGGSFSLDGVHLSKRGYAVIANKFLEVINMKYNAMIPYVNVGDYEGIQFP